MERVIDIENDPNKIYHKKLYDISESDGPDLILKIVDLPFRDFMHLKDTCSHMLLGSSLNDEHLNFCKRVSHHNYGQHHLVVDTMRSHSNVSGGSFKSFLRGVSHTASKIGKFVQSGVKKLQPVTHALSSILSQIPIQDPRYQAAVSALNVADSIQKKIADA
jgi:hypothetical protein